MCPPRAPGAKKSENLTKSTSSPGTGSTRDVRPTSVHYFRLGSLAGSASPPGAKNFEKVTKSTSRAPEGFLYPPIGPQINTGKLPQPPLPFYGGALF